MTEPARRVSIATWCLRAVVTVHAVTVLGQPILAGMFLDGDVAMLASHSRHGMMAAGIAVVQLAVALVWHAIVRPRPGVVVACAGLLVADAGELALGLGRVIGLHVPLGTAIVTGSLVLTVVVWRPVRGRFDATAGRLRHSSGSGQ